MKKTFIKIIIILFMLSFVCYVKATEEREPISSIVATSKKGKYKLVKEFTTEDELLEYVNSTKKGTTYYYKVRSYRVVDENKVYSSYGSIKSIRSK